MNIFEYFIERKRLNILNKELNCCDVRVKKLINCIYNENPFSNNKIAEYKLELSREKDYRDYLKEQLNK